MKKIILFIIMLAGFALPQTYYVKQAAGDVKAQIGANEDWIKISAGMNLNSNSILMTGKNSFVTITSGKIEFTLKESSAISLADIKNMSFDEFLLALAMEDIMDAPKKKEDSKTKNTAVYGADENGNKEPLVPPNNYGVKKLNGAVQLAESGFKESAVIVAREAFRKYPDTKTIASYRIYFASILYEHGLYDEAYGEFLEISKLNLKKKEKEKTEYYLKKLKAKISREG